MAIQKSSLLVLLIVLSSLVSAENYYIKNNVENLTEKMQSLADKPELRNSFRDKAVTRLASEYSWDAVTDKYEKLLAGK